MKKISKKEVIDKEFAASFNRCISNGIRIYPRPAVGVYKIQNKSRRNLVKPRVELVVDYGNKIMVGKEIYTQEEDMTNKIIQLYKIISSRI